MTHEHKCVMYDFTPEKNYFNFYKMKSIYGVYSDQKTQIVSFSI